jgi:hypothetical protein
LNLEQLEIAHAERVARSVFFGGQKTNQFVNEVAVLKSSQYHVVSTVWLQRLVLAWQANF